MNIVELENRMMQWVDRARSARFTEIEKDNAVNTAIDQFFYDRYDNIKQHKMYSFEFIQRVRDDLRTLVKTAPLTPSGNLVTYPSDYKHELSFDTIVNGIQKSSRMVSYDEYRIIKSNTFQEPTIEYPVHFEDQNGINVDFGGTGTFSSAILTYLIAPAIVFVSTVPIVAGPAVLTIGLTYYVTTNTVTHNAITYQVGQTFIAVNTALTGIGTVINIVNTDLPVSTHEELAKLAASIIIGEVENYSKSKWSEAEANKS
jgi:hypothetical protein